MLVGSGAATAALVALKDTHAHRAACSLNYRTYNSEMLLGNFLLARELLLISGAARVLNIHLMTIIEVNNVVTIIMAGISTNNLAIVCGMVMMKLENAVNAEFVRFQDNTDFYISTPHMLQMWF